MVSQEVVKRINKQYPLNAGHSIELQSVNGRPSIRSQTSLNTPTPHTPHPPKNGGPRGSSGLEIGDISGEYPPESASANTTEVSSVERELRPSELVRNSSDGNSVINPGIPASPSRHAMDAEDGQLDGLPDFGSTMSFNVAPEASFAYGHSDQA